MVASAEAESALGVLQLAESFSIDVKPGEWSQARPTLAIIPTQSGKLVTASRVVLAPEGVSVPDRDLVAGYLQSDSQAKRLLKDVLGVSEPDDRFWQLMLDEALRKISDQQPEADEAGWQSFWVRLRFAPESVRIAFCTKQRASIRVRRRDTKWVHGRDVLLPGAVVSESDTESRGVLLDLGVHGKDKTLLDLIGVKSELNGTDELSKVRGLPVFRDWIDACQKQWFSETFKGGSRPQDGYLQPLDGTVPKGLHFLELLRGAARARLTLALCARLHEMGGQRIEFGHSTRGDFYPRIRVAHPLPWLLLSHGELHISANGCAPLRALIARRGEPALQRLPFWSQVGVGVNLLVEDLSRVTVSSDDLRALWAAAAGALATPERINGDVLTDLWLGAAKDGVVPTELPSPTGRVPLSAAFVTTSADLARRARTPGRVVVVLDPPTMQFWLKAGAQDLAGLVQAEWSAIAWPTCCRNLAMSCGRMFARWRVASAGPTSA